MTKALAGLSTDLSNRTIVLIVLGCSLLAAGIFFIDIASLPLGVAAGVAYVAVVLIALWLPRWQYPIVAAGAVSILTILGFLWSEPAGIPWMVVANRLLAVAAIWLTAIVGSWLVHMRITVEDSGIGIESDQLAGIFDEFYRIEKDPAGRNGSLGLGLSIVERSASLMGTQVDVESEPGRGSRFSLLVPAGSATGIRYAGAPLTPIPYEFQEGR